MACSDRGRSFCWPGWIALCGKNGLVRSMSRKGDSPGSSAMGSFFGRLENEFLHHRGWPGCRYRSSAARSAPT